MALGRAEPGRFSHLLSSAEEREGVRAEREEQQTFASPETAKQWGRERGADFMLLGELNAIFDSEDGEVAAITNTMRPVPPKPELVAAVVPAGAPLGSKMARDDSGDFALVDGARVVGVNGDRDRVSYDRVVDALIETSRRFARDIFIARDDVVRVGVDPVDAVADAR